MQTDRNYYTTFEEAHTFAKKLMADFPEVGQTSIGYDKSMPDCPYTVKFDQQAFAKCHPLHIRGR